MLKIFAVRVAAEIERMHGEEALRDAALAVSSAKGEACSGAGALSRDDPRADIAFIALPKNDDPCTLQMLALCMDGTIRENFNYPILGTPCETVVGHEFRLYPSRLAGSFRSTRTFGSSASRATRGTRWPTPPASRSA